jgi:hypothetical protein
MPVSVIPGTANDRGSVNAADTTSNLQRYVIDMKEAVAELEPSEIPFVTMLTNSEFGTRNAASTKIEWPETEDIPAITVAAASFLVGATSFAVAAGTGAYFKPNDLIRNDLTGEVMRIDSVATDTLTVVRGIGAGGTGVASVGSADTIVRLSNASISGGTLPAIRMARFVFNFNYCQITRDPVSVTNDGNKVKMYGGNFLDFAKKQKRREHLKSLERTLFWGKRDLKTDSAVAGTAGYPQFMCGGLVSFISANITNLNGGTLSTTNLEAGLRSIFRYGSQRRIAFCSPLAFSALANFSLSKLATPTGLSVYGVKAKQYITGAGDELFLVLKRDWLDYPVGSASTNTPTGGTMVIVDPDNVNIAWLRQTSWLPDRQAPDADAQTGEYLSNYSLEVTLGGSSGGSGNGAHGIIRGFSG